MQSCGELLCTLPFVGRPPTYSVKILCPSPMCAGRCSHVVSLPSEILEKDNCAPHVSMYSTLKHSKTTNFILQSRATPIYHRSPLKKKEKQRKCPDSLFSIDLCTLRDFVSFHACSVDGDGGAGQTRGCDDGRLVVTKFHRMTTDPRQIWISHPGGRNRTLT